MQKRIAIVSDDILFAKPIESLLVSKNKDISVIICQSNEELNEMLVSFSCQLVLIDGGLKYKCCFEIIEHFNRKTMHNFCIWFFPMIVTKACTHKSKAMGVNRVISRSCCKVKLDEEIYSLLVAKDYSSENR